MTCVDAGCDILTIGQYLQPTPQHLPVDRWVHPDEFAARTRRRVATRASRTSKPGRWCDRATTRARSTDGRSNAASCRPATDPRAPPRRGMEEPACKPDPVRGALAPPATISLGDARGTAAGPFTGPVRPTRQLGRAVLERCLLGLAPGGGCQPRRSPAALVRSYRTVSPLPERLTPPRRSALCCPVREVAPAWLAPAPCPSESGLSSNDRRSPAAARPAPPPARIPPPYTAERRCGGRSLGWRWCSCARRVACTSSAAGPERPRCRQVRGAPALLQAQVRGAALEFVEAYRATVLGGRELRTVAATPADAPVRLLAGRHEPAPSRASSARRRPSTPSDPRRWWAAPGSGARGRRRRPRSTSSPSRRTASRSSSPCRSTARSDSRRPSPGQWRVIDFVRFGVPVSGAFVPLDLDYEQTRRPHHPGLVRRRAELELLRSDRRDRAARADPREPDVTLVDADGAVVGEATRRVGAAARDRTRRPHRRCPLVRADRGHRGGIAADRRRRGRRRSRARSRSRCERCSIRRTP